MGEPNLDKIRKEKVMDKKLSPKQETYKRELNNILKWGGTSEEKISSLIGLAEDLIGEL